VEKSPTPFIQVANFSDISWEIKEEEPVEEIQEARIQDLAELNTEVRISSAKREELLSELPTWNSGLSIIEGDFEKLKEVLTINLAVFRKKNGMLVGKKHRIRFRGDPEPIHVPVLRFSH
jgi:hypothetical protein